MVFSRVVLRMKVSTGAWPSVQEKAECRGNVEISLRGGTNDDYQSRKVQWNLSVLLFLLSLPLPFYIYLFFSTNKVTKPPAPLLYLF